jgi:hypothetical protein
MVTCGLSEGWAGLGWGLACGLYGGGRGDRGYLPSVVTWSGTVGLGGEGSLRMGLW